VPGGWVAICCSVCCHWYPLPRTMTELAGCAPTVCHKKDPLLEVHWRVGAGHVPLEHELDDV
jgi:hypothetical protein